MNILDVVTGAGNGAAVDQLARRFGLPPQQASSAVAALVPALAAGLQRNASNEGGLAGLTAALAGGKHDQYLDDPSTLDDPATIEDGNKILGHVLGSKDASRQVATQASQQTGVDPSILKKMLPLVAGMVMAGLSKQSRSAGGAQAGGGLGSVLGSLLGGGSGGGSLGSLAGMVGGMLGSRNSN